METSSGVLSRVRAGVIATLGLLAASGFAFPPEGKYREEIHYAYRSTRFTLVRTLNLQVGGKAEMYSEYRGDPPVIDLLLLDDYGELMREVRDHRKVKHSGSWRSEGGRIVAELTNLDAGGSRKVHSSFEFELKGDQLYARAQDKGDYGDAPLRLALIEKWGDVGGSASDAIDPKKLRGTYGWGETVEAEGGESMLARRLKLSDGGDAELISEYLGRRPNFSAQVVSRYGSLFAEVVSKRKISHRGLWKSAAGRIRVELSRVGSGDFAQNVSSVFLFDWSGNELVPVEQDRLDYGDRIFRMRRDWSPPRVEAGSSGPGKPPLKPTLGIERDMGSAGGGTLAVQNRKSQLLDKARLILRPDGKFELRVWGAGESVFRGRYSIEKGLVHLEATEAFGGAAVAAGDVRLTGDGLIGKIELRGRAEGKRMTLTFDARSA